MNSPAAKPSNPTIFTSPRCTNAAMNAFPERPHSHLIVRGEYAIDTCVIQQPGCRSTCLAGVVAAHDERLRYGSANPLMGEFEASEARSGIGSIEWSGDAANLLAALIEHVGDGGCGRFEVLYLNSEQIGARGVTTDEHGWKRRVEELIDPSRPDRDRRDQQPVDEAVSQDVVDRLSGLVGSQVEHQPEVTP